MDTNQNFQGKNKQTNNKTHNLEPSYKDFAIYQSQTQSAYKFKLKLHFLMLWYFFKIFSFTYSATMHNVHFTADISLFQDLVTRKRRELMQAQWKST